jgi:hypothetical protein
MKLLGLYIILMGIISNGSFDVPKQKSVIPIENEWQCSKCKFHNYEGTEKCYFCGTPR